MNCLNSWHVPCNFIFMKNISNSRVFGFAAILTLVLMGGLGQAKADDYRYDHHHDRAYGDSYYSHHGYWDGRRHFHAYEWRDGHQGYWDDRNGVRVFINL